MSTAQSYTIDLILLVLIMMFVVINLPTLSVEWSKPILSEIEDKTALTSDGSIYDTKTVYTGADLLMSIVAVDSNVPYPKSIKINEGPVIDLNNSWVVNKEDNIVAIYDVNGFSKLGTMLEYEVESITYTNNSGDPYWHYVLKEVTP